jgi:hypothetical protein
LLRYSLMTRLVCLLLLLLAPAAGASAAPVAVQQPEGVTHGMLVLRSARGEVLADGELLQTLQGDVVSSRLVFRFKDGSLYDETVTFTQKKVFRLLGYRLVQRGPSFPETTEVAFDRADGRYRARAGDESAEGTLELPEDLHNGLTGLLIRNLKSRATAQGHVYAFTPKPRLLRTTLAPEGEDRYQVGDVTRTAARYLVTMEIGGLTGVVATVIGKDPPDLRFWVSTGPPPAFLKFEGAMYLKGPRWRIELAAPRWPEER